MDNIDRILVVSRMTKDCREAIHLGISMAQKYEAELSVIHVVHDPLIFRGLEPAEAVAGGRVQEDL